MTQSFKIMTLNKKNEKLKLQGVYCGRWRHILSDMKQCPILECYLRFGVMRQFFCCHLNAHQLEYWHTYDQIIYLCQL